MRKGLFAVLSSSLIVCALGIGTSVATATTIRTWTVTPGGAITAALVTGTHVTFTDVTSTAVVTCGVSSLSASLKSGSGLPGGGIGSTTAYSLSSCSTGATITSGGLPWHLNAVSYNATTGVTSGRITGIHFAYSGRTLTGTCSGVVDGTSDTANDGAVPAKYTNATHQFSIVAGGNLHIYDNSCPGFNSGDQAKVTGRYAGSPAQTITSP